MTANNPIVHYKNSLAIVKVWVGISNNFLPTSRPSCVSDPNVWFCYVFTHLCHKSLNTIDHFSSLFSMLDHPMFCVPVLLVESNDPCAVVSPIFK